MATITIMRENIGMPTNTIRLPRRVKRSYLHGPPTFGTKIDRTAIAQTLRIPATTKISFGMFRFIFYDYMAIRAIIALDLFSIIAPPLIESVSPELWS